VRNLTDREALECVDPCADCVAHGCQKRSLPGRLARPDTIVGFVLVTAWWTIICANAIVQAEFFTAMSMVVLAWSTMAVGAWIRRDLGNPWGDR
jgi:hypothetical protein